MTVDEFFACYKALGQQETWVTLQVAVRRGLVAGLSSLIKGWRPRWFYVSANGGLGVRTIWKVPIRLGPRPSSGDLDRAELEARRRAQEAEDQAILAKAQKFKESQVDRPPKPVVRERIRPRPKPLGEKNLGDFVPRLPPIDPLKERSLKEIEALGVGKKKKRVRRSEEVSAQKRRRETSVKETSAANGAEGREVEGTPGRVGGPETVDVASEGMEVVPVVVGIAAGVARVVPEGQGEDGANGPGLRREEQPQGGPTPQGGGVGLTIAIYHARAVAGRLEFNEAELLRRLCSAQIEVTTLAGVSKLKADKGKAQLAKLERERASWKAAHADLQAVEVELESTRRQVVSLEFQFADEQKKQKDEADGKVGDLQKELESERAKAIEEKGRLQKELETERAQATAEKESLKKELEAEKAKTASERAALQKELDEERAKAASERAAYPDLCVAAVEQFKGSAKFQMVVVVAVASSLTMQESRGTGPSRTTVGGRTEAEVIESFQ
ncbi:caldesmon-like [Camellia sinensis]|uniref:caldesmon-like n=1 Tax=Camellia sinensis TaxID=4442 RepID=UPI001036BAA8|nr:caldesmon-like [Camellia sinensis]